MQFGDIVVVVDQQSEFWSQEGEITDAARASQLYVRFATGAEVVDAHQVELATLVTTSSPSAPGLPISAALSRTVIKG